MPLLLIFDRNNSHADPVKEARGCYRRGDIVEVLDDSKHDGDLVKNPIMPPWILVRITGITKEQALKYMEPYIDPATVGTKRPVTLRRRKHNVEVDLASQQVRNKIGRDRYIELSWNQVRGYIRNRMTGETAGVVP